MEDRFGQRFRLLRLALGESQTKCAARLGVEPSCVNNWEAGKSHPRFPHIAVIARMMGCSLEYFLEGTGEGPTILPAEAAAVQRALRFGGAPR
jgi:transcriptional regulator with XRE-family HTH domain